MNLLFIKNKKIQILGVALLLLIVGGYFSFSYLKTRDELSRYETNNSIKSIKEKDELLKELNKLVLLPQDEEPTIATVADAFRLRGQKFFERAENGDKVLVYANTQRAILYRPSTKKVIEIAPVNINNAEEAISGNTQIAESKSNNYVLGESTKNENKPEEQEKEPAKLAVYNGTTVNGLAKDIQNYLEKRFGKSVLSVEKIQNAEDYYDETIIIDVTSKYQELARDIEGMINGEIIEKPEDVNFPEVDLIVIAGKDIDIDDLIN